MLDKLWLLFAQAVTVALAALFTISVLRPEWLPSAPAPTSGYPVLLYGHGLGASRTQMTMMMETAARAGYATIAIDASSHGSRYSDVDVERDLAQALSAFSGTATGPDGFGDVEGLQTTFRLFHEFSNILAMRDEIAQTVLDWGSVVRMIRDSSVDLTPLLGGGPGPAPTRRRRPTRVRHAPRRSPGVSRRPAGH